MHILAFLLCGTLLASGTAAAVTDLDDPPSALPYSLTPGIVPVPALTNWGNSRGARLVDLGEDGGPTWAKVQETYVQFEHLRGGEVVPGPQFNFPGRFHKPAPCGWVDGAWDLDGDDTLELVVGSRSVDGTEIRVWILDARTLTERVSFPVPMGEDRDGDGLWDGYVAAVGPLPVPVDGDTVPALLLARNVRYDEFGRGLQAVDARTGAELWRADEANSILPSSVSLIDGDDGPSILLCGDAHENLDADQGEHVNGLRDDVPRLISYAADGTLRWRHDLPYGQARVASRLGDLDGDGAPELVLGGTLRGRTQSLLVVEPHDGRLLAGTEIPNGLSGLELGPVRPDGGRDVYLSHVGGELRRLAFRDARLTTETVAVSRSRCDLLLCADLLPPPGHELALLLPGLRLLITSLDGTPLLTQADVGSYPAFMTPLPMGAGRREVAIPRYPEPGASYLVIDGPRPAGVPPLLPILAVAGLLAAAAVILRRRPGAHAEAPPAAPPPMPQAMGRVLLLEALRREGHNRSGVMESVAKLRERLSMLNARTGERARPHVGYLRTRGLDRLDTILEAADAAGVAEHRVAWARGVVQELREALDRSADVQAYQGDREAAERLVKVLDDLLLAMERIRDDALSLHPTDLAAVAARVADPFGERMRSAGVTAVCDGPRPCAVTCDEAVLEHALDNLVVNALRALRGRTDRRLAVRWRRNGGAVELEVSDNGPGVPDALVETLFQPKTDRADGGGTGLPDSALALTRYDGRLELTATAPERGATFRIVLPQAKPAAAAAEA